MHNGKILAATTALLLAMSGCAAQGGQMTPTPSADSPSGRPPFASAGPIEPSGKPMTPSPAQLKAISEDLAERNVAGDFTVVTAISVTWRDGSLGCPLPGRVYTQSLVPGAQIVVSVAGTSYDYRFGRGDIPTLCENKR